MEKDFVDRWEGKSEEELFIKYIKTVAETNFHGRRSAARILARRKHQPTEKVLIEWLNDTRRGIGKHIEYEWGTATSPPYTLESDDAKGIDIIHLAVESLGLMGYILECQQTRSALEKLLCDDSLVHMNNLVIWALRRLDEPNEPEIEMEDDMLLYIAATARPNFFKEKAFKELVTKMISTHGREVARKYIEALRKVPDIDIPAESGNNDYFSRRSLIPLVASIGLRYGRNQEEFESLCQELLTIVRTSRGFERGVSHTTIGHYLYDGVSTLVNDGVELTVKDYIGGLTLR
jgi:hypothetical protein